MEHLTGSSVGNFVLQQPIGAGGMGVVFVGEHRITGHRVAIKVLRPEVAVERQMVQRLFDEARALTGLAHPGLVQVLDCGIADGVGPYLVMELLEGENLRRLMRRQPQPAWELVVAVLHAAAEALETAHEAGIVHRDLKPDNIHLLVDRRVKLLDFGIARMNQHQVSIPRTPLNQLLGTPTYMAPEQILSQVDHRADIYALGVVAFRLLAGRPPYLGEDPFQLLVQHQSAEIPSIAKLEASLPRALDALFQRALAKDPALRPQTACALVAELAQALELAPPALEAVDWPVEPVSLPEGSEGSETAEPTARTTGGLPRHLELTAAGTRKLDSASSRRCPHCRVELALRTLGTVEVDSCVTCGGIWLDAGELEALSAESLGGELERPAVELLRPMEKTALPCPTCNEQLIVCSYGAERELELDACALCEGIWLDEGELAQFQRGRADAFLLRAEIGAMDTRAHHAVSDTGAHDAIAAPAQPYPDEEDADTDAGESRGSSRAGD
jgi:Zn-finger nucleic acid-binding protein/tRNA A-37 threonylcarbamoyl transferase component Bud32